MQNASVRLKGLKRPIKVTVSSGLLTETTMLHARESLFSRVISLR